MIFLKIIPYLLLSLLIENQIIEQGPAKVYNSLIFKTRMLPCFNYLWELFYKDRVKIVPMNIGELLTPIG